MRFNRGSTRSRAAGACAALVAGAAVAALTGVSGAGADTADPTWNCRASAAYVEQDLIPNPGIERVEPIMANGNASQTEPDRAACADDDGGVPHVDIPDAASALVVADALYARTKVNPDVAAARDQAVESTAGVEKAKIDLPGLGALLEVNTINVSATASCKAGVPTYEGTSKVVDVKLGTVDLPLEGIVPKELTIPGLVVIKTNQKITSPEGLTMRGVQVQALPGLGGGAGDPLLNVVVGEAKVSSRNAVCAAPTPPPTVTETNTVTTPGQTVTTPGETQTQTVPGPTQTQTVPGPTQTVVQTVPGGPDTSNLGNNGGSGGSGGVNTAVGASSVDLADVKGVSKSSPCRKPQFGRQVALLGTAKGDRVTGTNLSDRIFTRGGRDKVSGGRGNDCVDGGPGGDELSGSNGADYLIGGPGGDRLFGADDKDVLDGGPGNDLLVSGSHADKIYGGSGNDTIHTGGNNDKVWAGPGNDIINAATAGYRQVVDCGPGRDKVRLQKYDRAINCEDVILVG